MVNVLLLGGHGKVALYITQFLVRNSHTVTSIIRNPEHTGEIHDFVKSDGPGKVHPKVQSLEDISDDQIQQLMTGIDWVVWSAGAGGKGGPERTKAVDLNAANRFFDGAIAAPSVKQFLTVSAGVARRDDASWWDEGDKKTRAKAWEIMEGYCDAKTSHDEYLSKGTRKAEKKGWRSIVLRPGTLSDDKGTGKVSLGKSKIEGKITREDVADVAVRLLEEKGEDGVWWVDLVQGEDSVGDAVKKVIQDKITVEP